jgi:hypothetical protein
MKKLAAIFILELILTAVLQSQLANPDLDQKFYDGQSNVVSALKKISTSNAKIFLYSLLPDNEPGWTPFSKFHGYSILGRTEITSSTDKKELLEAFIKGVQDCDSYGARCFNPHHGLRVIDGSKTNDFVICYECCHVYAYNFNKGVFSVGDGVEEFETSDSPKNTFDKFVTKYHLKYRWMVLPAVVTAMFVVILIFTLGFIRSKKAKPSQ